MKISSVFIVLLLVLGCRSEAQIYPNKNWATQENPAAQGWGGYTGRSLFTQYVIDSTNITGLVIVHKGEIVLEYGDIEENSYIASCRKSILAILFGNYVQDAL